MWQNILQWAEAHIEWAIPVVFVFAFLESLIIISLFVPGWLLLVGMGSLVGAGLLPFYPVVISAYVGAVIGEGLGFWVGQKHADWVQSSRFAVHHKAVFTRAVDIFKRYGVLSLVLGRFIGPIRAVLPFVAGTLRFPPRYYWPTNVLSGIAWAPAYLLPGMLIGASFQVSLADLWPLLFHVALSAAFIYTSAKLWPEYRKAAVGALSVVVLLLLVLPFMPYWALFLQVLRHLWQVINV